ncbi:c-type cytochrome [Methylobacterium oryzihabitans]|uniref:Cytochrome c n=1 Tax=Methylobacterium oryzihabitans TaxID=2499852 RepID=A0A3S2XIR6_9HYPH|nr:cytochrome c [Methylobacterium oryzihabitans]RVU15811.1 cytochrome c [Methylobacterium oryzihabitans]
MSARLLPLLVLPLLAACDGADMASQPKAKTWDANAFFPQGQTMRPPVPGTVPRAEPGRPVPEPAIIDAAMLERGRERYGVFCTPCHGAGGDGDGLIVGRGFPRPPSLHDPRLRAAPARHFYEVVSAGKGTMASYAAQVPPADRWAITAYVRALQLSRDAAVASLPAADRAALDGAR